MEIAPGTALFSAWAVDDAAAPEVARSRLKRAFDVLFVSVVIVVLAPVFVMIGLTVLAASGSPVLYPHDRIGLRGRPFKMLKFRTMVNGAHATRAELLAVNEAPFPAFKLREDPRVTRVGRILRMTSLDELPQLWNILCGQMSVVGPRPPLPDEVTHYDAYAMRRLAARPGLTCSWQVRHRFGRKMSFDEWVQLDVAYIDGWSLQTDVRLIAQTALAVLRFSGT